ncbi:hypothetical protein ACJJTC_007032 [Scirpophaga incertulas]
MGKVPFVYTDSEGEDTYSSVENLKKNKFSILKHSSANIKKKKCMLHSKSDSNDSDVGSRSRSRSSVTTFHKLRGILKNTREQITARSLADVTSDEDEDLQSWNSLKSHDRCLVGQVPRPPGAKPGRGGGVAIVVKKNRNNIPVEEEVTSDTKKRQSCWLFRKKSC